MNILTQNYLLRGFWGDEAWTALISSQSVSDLIRITGEDFHPPFYYLVVHFWGQIFGFSELAVRSISLIFYLLTIVCSYFLVKAISRGKQKAKLVTLLVALSPIFFLFAFEARNYALLFFLSVASALSFWKAREEKGYNWRIAYFFFSVAAMYTHYYAWFILASHGFYLLIFERDKIKKLFLTYLAMALSLLPWLPTFFSQIGQVNQSYWIAPMNASTHWEMIVRVISGDSLDKTNRLLSKIFLLVLALGISFRIFLPKRKKSKKLTHERPYIFLLTWILVPVLIPTLISLKTPIFYYRYLIFLSIPLMIFFVSALQQLPKKMSQIIYLLFALIFLGLDIRTFKKYPHTMREEYKSVQSQAQELGRIYTVLPSFAEVMYYVNGQVDLRVKPEGLVQFSGKSLLDHFVQNGRIVVSEPEDNEEYVLLTPGPESQIIKENE